MRKGLLVYVAATLRTTRREDSTSTQERTYSHYYYRVEQKQLHTIPCQQYSTYFSDILLKEALHDGNTNTSAQFCEQLILIYLYFARYALCYYLFNDSPFASRALSRCAVCSFNFRTHGYRVQKCWQCIVSKATRPKICLSVEKMF